MLRFPRGYILVPICLGQCILLEFVVYDGHHFLNCLYANALVYIYIIYI